MPADVTVVIPTYNRKEVLKKTLAGYAQQSALERVLEVLVVDDGSTDGTGEMVKERASAYPVQLRYLHQKNRGSSAARNHGIREASGSLLLFGDDDVIPLPHLVAEHLAWHEKYSDAAIGVMGYVTWSPEVRPTPFMRWLNEQGPQACYSRLRPGAPIGFQAFFPGNMSLKLEFLKQNGFFDEDFRTYGFEDLELGYRLIEKAGLRMLYNPRAVGYHFKRVTFQDIRRRVILQQAALRVMAGKEAGVHLLESVVRRKSTRAYGVQSFLVKTLVPILKPLAPLLDSRLPLPWSFYRAFYAYYAVMHPGLASTQPKQRHAGEPVGSHMRAQ